VEPDVPPVVAKVVRKGEKAATIHFSMGEPAWSPDFEIASKLEVGKPLPEGWTIKPGQFGPMAMPPKKERGMAVAYRNTKEAFEAEAASRLAWQQVEEERKDRRTALMTAVEYARAYEPGPMEWPGFADEFYRWLRSSPAVSEPAAERDVASKGEGQASAGAMPNAQRHEQPSPAGDTSSVSGGFGEKSGLGEDDTDTKPGEAKATPPSSPSPGFPISPAECDHKAPSGRWLKTTVVDGQARCPRCGESAVIYRESA
jgi:hypothetical protein